MILSTVVAETCLFLENDSNGFCESRPDARNCVRWKIARLYKCKAKATCTEAFTKSNDECVKANDQALKNSWAGKEINSQAVGLCFAW